MKTKALTATTFRIILFIIMALAVALIVGTFILGYRHMQTLGEDTAKRQADAAASADSIEQLKRLRLELDQLSGLSEKITNLRSSSTLPQFDTERSLRTIAGQLGIGVKNVLFIDGATSGAAASGNKTPSTTPTTPTTTSTKNSKISFEFDRDVRYEEFVRFLDAIETSSPKLTVDGISLPDGSTGQSINPGIVTLELAVRQ